MVDASLRAMILDIMLRLREQQNISFLYITHDLSTAYQVCDDIYILYQGSIAEKGDTVQRDRESEASLRADADRLHPGSRSEPKVGHDCDLAQVKKSCAARWILAAVSIPAAPIVWIVAWSSSHPYIKLMAAIIRRRVTSMMIRCVRNNDAPPQIQLPMPDRGRRLKTHPHPSASTRGRPN